MIDRKPIARRGFLQRVTPCSNQKARPGALLISVLVVLLLVGMLSSQAIQTLLLVRRGDQQRSETRQARELLELGRLAVLSDQVPESKLLEMVVDGQPAAIRFEPLSAGGNPRIRIVAELTLDSNRQVTVSWETPE